MGKKKSKPPERPVWEIDWSKVNSFNALREVVSEKFKLILESPVGNREEDILDYESSSGISDSSDSDLDIE